MHDNPSIATLKRGHEITHDVRLLAEALGNWQLDKGYAPQLLEYWLRQERRETMPTLETLIGRFLMRLPYDATCLRLRQALGASLYGEPVPTYRGLPEENRLIDQAIANSDDHTGYRDRIKRGAAPFFSLENYRVPAWAGAGTRIVILGAGAAGILVARTLLNAGYRNLVVVNETDTYGGIWRQPNVQLSRNNPVALTYEDFRVEAAPGTGQAITRFLDQLVTPAASTRMKPLPRIVQGRVVQVLPGDVAHTVVYRDPDGFARTLTTPILINALGSGEPQPLSRPGVIETDIPNTQGGMRWQRQISVSEAEQLRGKRVVVVGLGNSTMEMVVQLQRWNALGYAISYKVLTHHTQEALEYPTFPDRLGRQLYRDLTHPHLSGLAGDLEPLDRAFRRAWESEDPDQEEIIAEVCRWTLEQTAEEQWMVLQTRGHGAIQRFPFDQLYTLIGYGQTPERLHDLGLLRVGATMPVHIAHDHDGEFQQQRGQVGRARLFAGYFGFGALLSSPNAQVIAGMLYRLPDLLVGVTLRATESHLRNKQRNKHQE